MLRKFQHPASSIQKRSKFQFPNFIPTALRHSWFPIPALFVALAGVAYAAPTAEQLEFFESKVRPVFAEHCYSCHSAKAEKLKGDLRLDSSDGVLKGGSSGPAVVPGSPDASLLIKAVRYSDPDLQMPPKKKKLSGEQIAALEDWVKMGAPMPASPSAPPAPDFAAIRAKHWAFQPVKKPELPATKNRRWIQSPVDNFVLSKLEQNHLEPALPANRRTLIRRVTYDLTGLPPTFEEVEAFVHDRDPHAYEQLVDRLLASPHYGERWGRHWLDLARYADTKGYMGTEERRFAFAYTYRDYVVRAFNEDKPYDQFITEQLAADRITTGEDKRALAGLGFLTVGRRFIGNQNDIIDDRIDVVSRGLMGLTVTCARCHDHKFDPISTKDYYALHGVFASSHEPSELPLLGVKLDPAKHEDYLKQKAAIEKEIENFKAAKLSELLAEIRSHAGDYMLAATQAPEETDSAKLDTFASERKLETPALKRWIDYLEKRRKAADPIFKEWFDLGKSAPADSLKKTAEAYSKRFKDVDAEWAAALESAKKANKPAPVSLSDTNHEALRQLLYGEDAPGNLPKGDSDPLLARKITEGTAGMRARIEALNWTHPGAPPRAMALTDADKPVNSHVLIRGNPANHGDLVPRRFIQVLDTRVPAPVFTNGSGRLELARLIASRDNPLTARVLVNRVWLQHFGQGLVSTAGDFGVRTAEPVQHALLDFLAASFVEHGWSIKQLHRMILLSSTYQQSCDGSPAALRADPDNHLLSRMNRQRLDFEEMRDTTLAVAGKLDLSIGGLPVDLLVEPFTTRRTIYGYIDRQNLPGLFRTFDFANPDVSNQGRFHTTVPQQALFLMNSPFVLEQATNLANRASAKCTTDRERIRMLYELALQRKASDIELKRAEKFLKSQSPTASMPPLAKLSQVLLFSNELAFVD